MKNQRTEDLQKRIMGDCLCTIVVTIGIGIGTIIYAINFITSLIGTKIDSESPAVILGDLVRLGIILTVFVILSLFMKDLRNNGCPFTLKNIVRLRVIAVLTMISAVLPELVKSFAGFLDDTAIFTLTFTLANAVLLLLGVVFGIVSEVFKYGYELQQEMDSIA